MINNLDSFHIEDLKNKLHPSVFFSNESYDLLILRVPYLSNNSLIYESLAFVITENEYLFYNKTNNSYTDMKNMQGFYNFLNSYVDNTLNSVNHYWSEIEAIEDNIYEGTTNKRFNKQWYRYKTDLIRINRVLNKALDTLNIFIRNYKKEEDYLERNFEDLFEHVNRAQRNAEFLLEKLDSIYSFHQNQTNEQMNRIVYILTLLSGIFLPLNLIVGFFGMNTTSLPFTQAESGTFKVIGLLVISSILATLLTLFMRRK